MRVSRPVFGFSRQRWAIFLAAFVTMITAAVAYDHAIDQVSATRAMLTGRYAKCGPPPSSGPKEAAGTRTLKTHFVMARLPDGQLIRVERPAAGPLPTCGATLAIAQRVTPWGTVWYSTTQ
jgi:hypothetical protein